jgi:hypothetical protein
MAGLSLRDRFFTPRVARAMMSPSGLLMAGGGAALAILLGLPPVVAVAVAASAWALRVALAARPRTTGERIDPFTVNEPWRRFVQDALTTRGRVLEATDRTRPGPLRESLSDAATRLDTAVQECWRIAKQGHSLVRARRDIDTASIDRDLAEAEAQAAADADNQLWARTLVSLQAQRAAAERMDQVIDKARSELKLLDARLGEAAVRAVELSAQSAISDAGSGLSLEVDNMVSDLETLRQALEEVQGTAGGLHQGPDAG